MDGRNYTLDDALQELATLEAAAHEAKVAKDAAAKAHKIAGEKVDEVRSSIRDLMLGDGVLADETPLAKVVIAQGEKKSLVIEDEELIPEEFYELVPVRLDDKIQARLLSGVAVAGARLDREATNTVRVTWKKK